MNPPLVAICTILAVSPAVAVGVRPNVVFLLADDWGWGDLSCHGSPVVTTPHLDRLAREGTDFRRFSTAGPVCSPSRTAFMNGVFPARLSVHRPFGRGEDDNPDVVARLDAMLTEWRAVLPGDVPAACISTMSSKVQKQHGETVDQPGNQP